MRAFARNRYLQRVLAWVVVGTGAAWLLYDWLTVDGGLRYFAQDYRHLLLLLLIVAVGTPALLGYKRLSDQRQRRIEALLIAILAVSATGFAASGIYQLVRLAGFLIDTGQALNGVLAVTILLFTAAVLWWAFYRIVRAKPV